VGLKVKRFDGIAIVPFIDIMLVLVVLVLSLSTFIAEGEIPVSLPDAKSQSREQTKPVTLTIKATGELYYEQDRVELDELDKRAALIAKDSSVVIKADRLTDFEKFTQVAGILNSHAIQKVSIITVKN
jgi:biopolymer transport protein ExbD